MSGERDIVDLFVIGGGINGAGIARDAAGRGLSVILCEKDDLARGHQLALGQARPWRPALSRILRIPAGARGADRARGAARVRAAHHLADALRAAAQPGRPARPGSSGSAFSSTIISAAASACPARARSTSRTAPEGAPIKDGFKRGFEYSDCWVDDARLVVLNALDASERGAKILTRTACTAARRENGLWSVEMRDSRTGVKTTRPGARAGQCRRPLGQ